MENTKIEHNCKNCKHYKSYYVMQGVRFVAADGYCSAKRIDSRRGAEYKHVRNCNRWEAAEKKEEREETVKKILLDINDKLDVIKNILTFQE